MVVGRDRITLCCTRCRVEEFARLVPRQPWLARNTTGEVRLEFEAVQLDISRETHSQLWVHVRTMACAGPDQCGQVGDTVMASEAIGKVELPDLRGS